MLCHECGKEAAVENNYCVYCGSELEKKELVEEAEGDWPEEYIDLDEDGYEIGEKRQEDQGDGEQPIEEVKNLLLPAIETAETESLVEKKRLEEKIKQTAESEPPVEKENEKANGKRFERRSKVFWGVGGSAVAILLATPFLLAKEHSGEENLIRAINEHDYEEIMDNLASKEEKVTRENVESLFDYYENSERRDELTRELKEGVQNKGPIDVKTVKNFPLPERYEYDFIPYEVTVFGADEGVIYEIDDWSYKAEFDGEVIRSPPLIIGRQTLYTTYENEDGLVEEELPLNYEDVFEGAWYYKKPDEAYFKDDEADFERESEEKTDDLEEEPELEEEEEYYVTIYSSEPDAELIVNGEYQGVYLDSGYEVGPMTEDETVYVQAVRMYEWGETYTKTEPVNSELSEYTLTFEVEEYLPEEEDLHAQESDNDTVDYYDSENNNNDYNNDYNDFNNDAEYMDEENWKEEERELIYYAIQDHAWDWVNAYTFKDTNAFNQVHHSYRDEYLERVRDNFEEQEEGGWVYRGEITSVIVDAATLEIYEESGQWFAEADVQLNFYSSYFQEDGDPEDYPKENNSSQWKYELTLDYGGWMISDQEEMNKWEPDEEYILE